MKSTKRSQRREWHARRKVRQLKLVEKALHRRQNKLETIFFYLKCFRNVSLEKYKEEQLHYYLSNEGKGPFRHPTRSKRCYECENGGCDYCLSSFMHSSKRRSDALDNDLYEYQIDAEETYKELEAELYSYYQEIYGGYTFEELVKEI